MGRLFVTFWNYGALRKTLKKIYAICFTDFLSCVLLFSMNQISFS